MTSGAILGEHRAERRSLAGAYLEQALDQLDQCGRPSYLYIASWALEPPDSAAAGWLRITARARQLAAARTATLFAALAAEAYVNEFLDYFLSGRDLQAIDRLSTIDKYVVGARLALGRELFTRDVEPIPAIHQLFKHRNKLVHPKPEYGPPGSSPPTARQTPEFTPLAAARFIISVSGAAGTLVRAVREGRIDYPADIFWYGRDAIAAYARRAARIPAPAAEPERPLIDQALQHVRQPQTVLRPRGGRGGHRPTVG